MNVYLILTFILIATYGYLIYYIYRQWREIPDEKIPDTYEPQILVTIIIIARNEATYIESCLQSIICQDYPLEKMEIILVDDHSTDDTTSLAEKLSQQYPIRILHNVGSGKKEGIKLAVSRATNDYLLFTDADCVLPPEWCKYHAYMYEVKEKKISTGLISYPTDESLVTNFQSIDAMNTMAITAVGIHTGKAYSANGANMSFEKSLYNEVNALRQDGRFQSGDDMFLMDAAANILPPDKIGFVKSPRAIVPTAPEYTLKDLLEQRKRWATKSSAYQDSGLYLIQVFVFLYILCTVLLILCSFIFDHIFIVHGIVLLLAKIVIDYTYLRRLNHYFDNIASSSYLPMLSILYIPYIIFMAWHAVRPTRYSWKGRRVD